jgi:hypothetical protein
MNIFRLLLVALLLLAAVPVRFYPESPDAGISASNLFDPGRLKPGDRVAGMEIVRTDLTPSGSEYLGTVQFRGPALVEGTYRYRRSDESHGGIFAFYVDEDSRDRLPVMTHDRRDPWFGFTNLDEAKRMFGIPDDADEASGRASVVIDDYFIHYDYREVYNTARLLEVHAPEARP